MELWTGENQFNTEPTRGSCLIIPCNTHTHIQNIWMDWNCIHTQNHTHTYTPLPWVSPHWPSAAAALPPGCLSSPPPSCSPEATQDRITTIYKHHVWGGGLKKVLRYSLLTYGMGEMVRWVSHSCVSVLTEICGLAEIHSCVPVCTFRYQPHGLSVTHRSVKDRSRCTAEQRIHINNKKNIL